MIDIEVDIVRILLNDASIEESNEDLPGIIIDYDRNGHIVGIEILDASKRMPDPRSIAYTLVGSQ
ncbi:MAG: DUF2283 domain-containing protein [Chloroflexaceae bacterium]|nr:DUF2283 domain-containing protein [Chloroflexaceae bacterium]